MRRRVREQAKCRACILVVRDSKKARNDLDVAIHRDARGYQPLRPPVEQDNQQSQRKMYSACAVREHSGRYCKRLFFALSATALCVLCGYKLLSPEALLCQ